MDTEMRKLEEAAESVKKQFQQLDKTLPKDEVFVSVALGAKEIHDLFRDLGDSAQKEILLSIPHEEIAKNSSRLVEETSTWLANRASNGVSVKVLISAPIPPVLEIFQLVEERTEGRLQIRAYPVSLNHYKVIDRKYVLLDFTEPYEPNTPLVLVQLFSKKLAEHQFQIFERCWRKSIPPRTLNKGTLRIKV